MQQKNIKTPMSRVQNIFAVRSNENALDKICLSSEHFGSALNTD